MNEVSAWLLSITGIILLSVLAEFVLPEGHINKYTKVIFSFVILLVIIMPLPKIFGKDFDISKFFSGESQLQDGYLEQINLDKLSALGEAIALKVENEGMLKVEISVNADIKGKELNIYGVSVDMSKIQFAKEFGKTDFAKAKLKIREIIDGFPILEKVEVKFYE